MVLFEETGTDILNDHYMEFMAMATVCDVVKLTGENRVIVRLGLDRLAHTRNIGLSALIDEKGIDRGQLNEYHLGFLLGPCFNATGRIDDAGMALMMLIEKDPQKAAEYARQCSMLNDERKEMTAQQEIIAADIVEKFEIMPRVLVVELKECHESILGIIAGRLKDRFNRPAIVATVTSDGYKASGRSTENYNIFEELKKCSDLLVKFGGHPMAAGLTVKSGCLDELRTRLNENCTLEEKDMFRKVLLDLEVSFNLFDMRAVEELSMFAPFGQGNPSPLFGERDLRVLNMSYIGRDNKYLKLMCQNRFGHVFCATMFSNVSETIELLKDSFGGDQVRRAFTGQENGIVITAAYVPKINEFRETREIQMNIRHVKITKPGT